MPSGIYFRLLWGGSRLCENLRVFILWMLSQERAEGKGVSVGRVWLLSKDAVTKLVIAFVMVGLFITAYII